MVVAFSITITTVITLQNYKETPTDEQLQAMKVILGNVGNYQLKYKQSNQEEIKVTKKEFPVAVVVNDGNAIYCYNGHSFQVLACVYVLPEVW